MIRSFFEKSALHAENYKYYYVIKQHIFRVEMKQARISADIYFVSKKRIYMY